MRVIASGFLKSRSYEKDGEKRTVTEFEILEIGPSLKNASATVKKAQRGNSSGFNQPAQPSGFGPSTAQSDPWATPDGFSNGTQDPPF